MTEKQAAAIVTVLLRDLCNRSAVFSIWINSIGAKSRKDIRMKWVAILQSNSDSID